MAADPERLCITQCFEQLFFETKELLNNGKIVHPFEKSVSNPFSQQNAQNIQGNKIDDTQHHNHGIQKDKPPEAHTSPLAWIIGIIRYYGIKIKPRVEPRL